MIASSPPSVDKPVALLLPSGIYRRHVDLRRGVRPSYSDGCLLRGFLLSSDGSIFPSILPILLNQLSAKLAGGSLHHDHSEYIECDRLPGDRFISDSHRGPLGRRIPFILYTIPFLCVFLILIGRRLWPISGWLVQAGFIQGRDGRGVDPHWRIRRGAFQFFNMFVASVYYYLFNDVVPRQFLGRFLAAFRLA